jgi:mono/diheme cytochrome c family protein
VRVVCILVGVLAAAPCAAAQDRAAIDAGAAVYAEHCAICHGERLINTGTAFDLRQLRADERPRFDKAMAEGKGQMPAWEGVLSEEEIGQVWAYIRSKAVN